MRVDGWIHEYMGYERGRWVDGWIGRWMDRWMYVWIDG